jgi:phospholipase A1/A2
VVVVKTVLPLALVLALLIPSTATALELSSSATEFSLIHTGRGLTLHKTMGALPFTSSAKFNGLQSEVVFQLSAKHDILGSRFYLAYSQISFWQAYDSANSSPFRDTNYNPELFYRFPETSLGRGFLGADLGVEHESNGQQVPLSRSWNLIYLAPFYHGDGWLVYAKLRYRIPENAKETPMSSLGDDNPDITDYLGYSDIHLYYAFPAGHLIHIQVRGYLGVGKGNVCLDYSIPIPRSPSSFMMFRVFNGYGESLLDYASSHTRFGLGIMFNR